MLLSRPPPLEGERWSSASTRNWRWPAGHRASTPADGDRALRHREAAAVGSGVGCRRCWTFGCPTRLHPRRTAGWHLGCPQVAGPDASGHSDVWTRGNHVRSAGVSLGCAGGQPPVDRAGGRVRGQGCPPPIRRQGGRGAPGPAPRCRRTARRPTRGRHPGGLLGGWDLRSRPGSAVAEGRDEVGPPRREGRADLLAVDEEQDRAGQARPATSAAQPLTASVWSSWKADPPRGAGRRPGGPPPRLPTAPVGTRRSRRA